MTASPRLLYLHGFRSSPQSFKARLIGERMAAWGLSGDYCCPQLPASPRQAMDQISRWIEREQLTAADLSIVGSSLGGFYATWLAERVGCKAVLLNPAVKPSRELAMQVGVRTTWHTDEPFDFRDEHVAELDALQTDRITRPERYFLVAATGDEVLDWREMASHYAGARQRIIAGSDHGISDFAAYLDEVLQFCGIGPTVR